jgi:hypothetical protein
MAIAICEGLLREENAYANTRIIEYTFKNSALSELSISAGIRIYRIYKPDIIDINNHLIGWACGSEFRFYLILYPEAYSLIYIGRLLMDIQPTPADLLRGISMAVIWIVVFLIVMLILGVLNPVQAIVYLLT